jgi:ubiquinone/menaquinone biosynthesis C-methylase UbiE
MLGFGGEYRRLILWNKLFRPNRKTILEDAVGGHFDLAGLKMVEALDEHGLTESAHLVDIGCGVGRLAVKLKDRPNLRYSGYDVVPEMLDRARAIVARPDWHFGQLTNTKIPLPDASADMVCFFSVFTHLNESIVREYLQESRRIVRLGGKVVFSFLDLEVQHHRAIFQATPIRKFIRRIIYPLNISWSRETIQKWSSEYGYTLSSIQSPHNIGQSLAVLIRSDP